MIGTTEILIIGGVILVLFGASALPKFARSIGKARSEFDKGMKEARDSSKTDQKTDQEEEKEGDS